MGWLGLKRSAIVNLWPVRDGRVHDLGFPACVFQMEISVYPILVSMGPVWTILDNLTAFATKAGRDACANMVKLASIHHFNIRNKTRGKGGEYLCLYRETNTSVIAEPVCF